MGSRRPDCGACGRYAATPIWGHDMCSVHRSCCKNPEEWEPLKCEACISMRDMMEEDFLTEEKRLENFETLSKMLYRTMRNKAIQKPGRFWQYEKIAQAFFGSRLPSFPWYGKQASATRDNSLTPDSECGLDDQYEEIPDSDVGDRSRLSVGAAMNHQTRDMIDKEMYRENARLEQRPYSLYPHWDNGATAYNGYQPVFPNFRVQHAPHFNQSYDQAYPNRHLENNQQGAYAENRPYRQMRSQSPEHRHHHKNQQNNPGCPQPYDDRHKKKSGRRCRSPSSDNGRQKNSRKRRCSSPSSDNGRQKNSRKRSYSSPSSDDSSSSESASSSDTDDSDMGELTEGENKIIFDPYDHQPWIVYDRKIHEKLSDNRMLLPASSGHRVTAEVIYNPSNPKLFRTKQISDTNRLTPFLGATEAHNMIMRGFELRASDSVSPNKTLRIVDSRLTPNSGLSQLLELLKIHDPMITKATRDDKSEKEIIQAFPDEAFDSISVINLNKGWPFIENDYIEWAKDRPLSLEDFKDAIRFDALDTSKCTSDLLKKERESRKLVVFQLQSTHLVELYSNKVGSLDDATKSKNRISAEEGQAIAQTMLPIMKHLIVQWVKAKMAVRKALFYNNDFLNKGNVSWILKSSLWDSNIFPNSAIDHLRYEVANDVADKLGYRVVHYGDNLHHPNKRMKHFQYPNQPGPSQGQRPGKNSNQKYREQFIRQQKFLKGGKKKGNSKKKKKWIKASKGYKGNKGPKTKQNSNKNQKDNTNNSNNKDDKQER